MRFPEINATVPVEVQGPYQDIVVSPEAIQDTMEAQEAGLITVREPRQEDQAPIAELEEAHVVINRQHAPHHEAVVTTEHGQVLPEVADIVDQDPVPQEAVVIVLLPEAQGVMAEVLEDQEALAEALVEVLEVLVGVPQVDVLLAAEAAVEAEVEGTNSKIK